MRIVLFILPIVFLLSCKEGLYVNDPPNPDRLCNEVTKKAALQLKQDKDLWPFGFGGRTADGIEKLYLAFNYYRDTNLERARELLIASVDEFISTVNSNERIHPYLRDDYLFKPENVHIEIFIRNLDGSSISPGKLCVIIANQGILEYRIQDPAFTSYNTKELCTETYEEAVEKIQETRELRTKPITAY